MGIVRNLLWPRIQAPYTLPEQDTVAVLAVPFNRYIKGELPDKTNDKIAHVAAEQMEKHPGLVFVGQWEQADILRHIFPPERVKQFPTVGDGEWVQTHVLVKWMAHVVLSINKGNKVALVGHPHHTWRFYSLAKHYGLDPQVVPECRSIPYDHTKRPGYQAWCTSPLRYLPWELFLARPALILYALSGKLR